MQDRNNMSRTSSPLASCFINADNRVELAKFSYDAARMSRYIVASQYHVI